MWRPRIGGSQWLPLASRSVLCFGEGHITPDRAGTAHKQAIAMIKLTRLDGEAVHPQRRFDPLRRGAA